MSVVRTLEVVWGSPISLFGIAIVGLGWGVGGMLLEE
jgi:hypothetical protein